MTLPVSFKTIANVLGIVLLIALVAPFVVYAVPGVIGADHSFVVLTASMTPAIAPGDVVIVAERDPAAIVEGDVITFVRGDNEVPVTHRVIDVVDGPGGVAFETQGDANGAPDASLVPGANVIGAVALTIPYIGYVIQFAGSPLGFAVLVVLPFALLALSEVWSLYRARSAASTGAGAAEAQPSGDERADTDPSGDDVSNAHDGGVADGTTGVGVPASPAADAGGFMITDRTLEGGLGVLLVFAPYAVYVAYTTPTALTIAFGTGAVLTTLGIAVLLVAGRRARTPVAVDETADEADVPVADERVDEADSPILDDGFDRAIDPSPEPTPDGGMEDGDHDDFPSNTARGSPEGSR